jgi:disulfide bond formation protein DsbB
VTAGLSRLLNALGLVLVDTVLVLAFADQIWFRELPCPLCILQRAAFVAAGFGLALTIIFGPRPSHYGIVVLGAVAGAAISMRQILIHIVPGTGAYGSPIFGLHLYTWSFIAFALMIIGAGAMLLFERQFARAEPIPHEMRALPLSALAVFALMALGNIVSTLFVCGIGLCPDNPTHYLLVP